MTSESKQSVPVTTTPGKKFEEIQQSRDLFERDVTWHYTQTPKVDWMPGQGANDDSWKQHKKIAIDPFAEDRKPVDNYRLLVSGVVPRPIGFVSTVSSKGERNLAPFSYFAVVNSDPPIFTIGFSGSNPKDTARNILENGELTINIISEWFVEAANFCAINSPNGVDEWKLSGLTPQKSNIVKPDQVAESAFSIEAKLIHSHEWKSKKDPERKTGILCIVEGVQFHVREDVISDELNSIDIEKLKPVSRLGGISFGRSTQGYEGMRPVYETEVENNEEVKSLLN